MKPGKTVPTLILFFAFVVLNILAQPIVPLLQTGHSNKISCMAVSKDGKFLITGSYDNTMKVWDLASGQIIKNYQGHAGPISSVAFSEDGFYVISSSADKNIRIWEFIKNPDNKIIDKQYEFLQQRALRYDMMTTDDIKNKFEETLLSNFGCLQIYMGHKDPIKSLQADSDFKNFITLSTDNTIKFWDPLKVKELSSIPANNANQLVLSADGSKFYTLENDGHVGIYKYSSQTKIGELSDAKELSSLVISKDKKWIGGIDENSTIFIWDASKQNKIATIKGMKPGSDFTFIKDKASIIFCSENNLVEYDFKTNTILKSIRLPEKIEGKLVCTENNQFACGITTEDNLLIIDIQKGIVKNNIPSITIDYNYNVLSPDGKKAYSLDNEKNQLVCIELYTGKTSTVELSAPASKIIVSKDSKIVMAISDNYLLCFNAEDLTSLPDIHSNEMIIDVLWPENSETILLHCDSKKINSYTIKNSKTKELTILNSNVKETILLSKEFYGSIDNDNLYRLQNLSSGKEIIQIPNIASVLSSYSYANSYLALYNTKSNIEIWNTTQNKKIKEIQIAMKAGISQLLLNNTGQYISILFNDGKIKIYDINSGYEIAKRVIVKRQSKINPISFTPNDKFLFCASTNNKLILWSWKDDKEIQIINGVNGAVIIDQDNHYIVSNKGVDLIAFKKGTEYYTFEQFDLHFNRPDLVLQNLGYVDENLIKAYRQAYNKRLKKLGFRNSFQGIGIHVPEISIENTSTIPATTKDTKITLKLKAKDSDYLLKSILISVNGVPEGGVKGIDISDKKIKEYENTVDIKLSQGLNTIKIWSMNEKGAESYKKSIQIMCEKVMEKPTLYITTIGVSAYQNKALNLTYAAKDARDLIRTLTSQSDRYKKIVVDSLLNENATLDKILETKQRLMQSGPDDIVIVFYAGHGLLNNTLDYFLATHDIDFTNPTAKGLPYEKLENILDGIPARNKLLLMDACHSGEVDKDELQITATQESSTTKEEITFRAVPGSTSVKTIGLSNSFEMMKQLFSDLRKGNGTTVISSAGGAEYAMEGDNWNNGVFTYCLLKALKEKLADRDKDSKIMLSELQDFLQDNVSKITNGKQKPTSRAENISNDWQIW